MPLRLKSLELQGYKTFATRTTFEFAGGMTAIVGPNGSGKSTILNALNVLFRNTQTASNVTSLEDEDFYLKNITRPITITATFTDLSETA